MDIVFVIVVLVWLTTVTAYLVFEKLRPAPPTQAALSEELKQTIRAALVQRASTKPGRDALRARLVARGIPVLPEHEPPAAPEGHA